MSRLASFPELNPAPIIETDLDGAVTYTKIAVNRVLPEILIEGSTHEILTDIVSVLPELKEDSETLAVRTTVVKDKVFEQNISYLPDSNRLRSYVFDITERKQTENLR